jgi:hypothetical protein
MHDAFAERVLATSRRLYRIVQRVVPTASQTLGKFTVVDARQAGYIADRDRDGAHQRER